MAWLSGWSYRRKITISGSSGAGTNYQVLLKIGESSGATDCHFHLDGLSANFPSGQNQGGDLRFTTDDGVTLLSFWVDRVSGTSPNRVAYVWVKVSADLNSNQSIYCYFGNRGATNGSSGKDTFEVFIDGTTDESSQFTLVDIYNSGLNASFSWSSSGYYDLSVSGNEDEVMAKINALDGKANLALRAKIYKATSLFNTQGGIAVRRSAQGNYARTRFVVAGTEKRLDISQVVSGSDTMLTSFSYEMPTGVWKIVEAKVAGQSFVADWYNEDGTIITSLSATLNSAIQSGEWGILAAYDVGTHDYFKEIIARKYVSPEPSFSSADPIESSGWLSGWKYRRGIRISGSPGAGTGYQVLLKVGESSGATGCDFHLDGRSANFPSGKNQGGDLRFVANDGRLLNFWVETVLGSAPNRVAYIWVKIIGDLGGDQYIYCYFANQSATNASNGDATFLFFDDFDGSSLNNNKWASSNTGGSITVSNSYVDLRNSTLNGETWIQTWSPTTDGATKFKAEAKGNHAASVNTGTDIRNRFYVVNSAGNIPVSPDYGVYSDTSGPQPQQFWKGWTGISLAYTNEMLYSHTLDGAYYTWTISFYQGSQLYANSVTQSALNFNILSFRATRDSSLTGTSNIALDWVRVRKYISPEPAFSSASGIQVLPSSRRLFLMPI